MGVGDRLLHALSALRGDSTVPIRDIGMGSTYDPTLPRFRPGTERSIVTAVYNRIAIDVSAINIIHARLDQNERYESTIKSGLNECLTVEANIDQTGRQLIQDICMSMFDEGVVAVVPVERDLNSKTGNLIDIRSLRTAKIIQWYPQHIQVSIYNDQTGAHQYVVLPKNRVAIIENPLYAVMNEPNSTLKRLMRKLNILDAIDEQSGSGKLDVIIQVPYTTKSETRRQQAERRRKDIEVQLAGSKYGIAYIDGTEHVTQLNRPAENHMMSQIEYLTSMLYGQLGITDDIIKGTADEKTYLNYYNQTIEPICSAIVNEMTRKFLTKTARTQGQTIMFVRDAFKLVPVQNIADIADKFTRNEILSPNDIRAIIGYKPDENPESDELRNRNLNKTEGSNSAEPQSGLDNSIPEIPMEEEA